LDEQSRLCSDRPFGGGALCQGLVIDDYFAVAKIPIKGTQSDPAAAMRCLKESKDLFKRHDILGCDGKDVSGERKAKVIGAFLNASPQCPDRGHVLVSAPPEKRYSLAWLSLQLCQFTHTTDSLEFVCCWWVDFHIDVQAAFHVDTEADLSPS